MPSNVNVASNREEFRARLEGNHATETECRLSVRRGKPGPDAFAYLDAVEEALCFGRIDVHLKGFPEYGTLQRFTPGQTEALGRSSTRSARRLERLGLMTDAGRKCLPAMGPRSFRIDPDVVSALKAARCLSKLKSFPPLYQRVRADNIQRTKGCSDEFRKRLDHLIEQTRKGCMYGDWNDFGSLPNPNWT